MGTLQEGLQKRFVQAMRASRFDSLTLLSKESGCSPSRAAKIARGDFLNSKDGPGAFGLWRMAQNLSTTLDELLPPATNPTERPGVTAFFSRYNQRAPLLSDFKDILRFCDVYKEPRLGKTRLHKVGINSLLGERTNIYDATILQITYESWSNERRKRIYDWQRRAWNLGALAEPEYFDGNYQHTNRNIQIPVLRAACRVFCDSGKEWLLLYCDPLWHEGRDGGKQ